MKALKKGIKSTLLDRSSEPHHAVGEQEPTAQPGPSVQPGPSHHAVQPSEDEFFDADEPEDELHPEAHEDGGFGFTNRELLASQRAAIMDLVKEVGKRMLTGSVNLTNLSMPVKMFEARSYLQKLTDPWVYPEMLDRAAAASDPVERMQWVVTWFVAGLQHVYQSWKKPFNPLLGETWQATQDGGRCQIYLEQISHHPPISAFELIGPENSYTFTGHSQPDVQYKGSAVKTTAKGYRALQFPGDGTRIEIMYPSYYMRGIVTAEQPRGDVTGAVTFTDIKNSLACHVDFGKVSGAEAPLLRRPDSLSGSIFRLPPGFKSGDALPSIQPKQSSSMATGIGSLFRSSESSTAAAAAPVHTVSHCVGNWLSYLDWDGTRRWSIMETAPSQWTQVAAPLPSDSRFRLDLATLAEGDIVGAQEAKVALEERQRHDAKVRKEANAALQ